MSAERADKLGGRRLPDPKECQHLAEQMLSLALKAGADGAEVLVRDGTELEVKVRLGEPELVKEAGSRALGLRVLKDDRAAVTYTSDFTPAALERFARETVELAELAEPDPAGALPAREEMAREVPELDLWDDAVLSVDVAEGLRRARAGRGRGAEARQAGHQLRRRGVRPHGRRLGVRDVGGIFGSVRGTARLVRRRADLRRRRREEAQRRLLDARRASRTGSAIPRQIGLEAARRTVAKLGARKIPTGAAPVVFSPDAGRGLVGQLAGVLSGGALWRRSTYLADREGTAGRVAADRPPRRSADQARRPARAPTTAKGWPAGRTC